jgi:hypothetical protein
VLDDDARGGLAVQFFKIRPKMASHRKTRLIPRDKVEVSLRTAAMGAWWFAACWAAEEETDGFIPAEETERFDSDGILIPWLIKAGYFEEATVGGERGYILHDWLDIQESKAKLDAARAIDAAQKRKARAAKATRPVGPDSPPDGDGPGEGRPADVPEGVPGGHVNGHPTDVPLGLPLGLPDGVDATSLLEDLDIEVTTLATESPPPTRRTTHAYSPAFEAWWALYPRSAGKRPASLKFEAALKKSGVTIETLMIGVKRYAASRQGQDPKFTLHAKTWLNEERWNDGPDLRVVSGILDY